MEALLQRHLQDNVDEITLIAGLVSKIRPQKSTQAVHAEYMIGALCHILGRQPELRTALRVALLKLLGTHKPVSLYVESGILPSTGFFTELYRRVSHKILPEAIDPHYLKDIFALIFTRHDDEVWVNAVPDVRWLELLTALRFDEQAAETILPLPVRGIVDAVLVLSYRISSIGLEPELIRNEPSLDEFASPFLTQNDEVGEYLEQFALAWADSALEFQDERHILVLLDQCAQIIQRIRRTASRFGTSISLTFLLQRLTQQLERMEHLLAILAALREEKSGERARPLCVGCSRHWSAANATRTMCGNTGGKAWNCLALRVTENASRTGEHYITSTRSGVFCTAEVGHGRGADHRFHGGAQAALAKEHLPPLTEALLFSLNYGLGFMLIHILHFTVATKQPAMTASAIAASISERTATAATWKA